METYVFSVAKYIVCCPEDRQCEIGMGVFLFGKPLGERVRFSGEKTITVVGAGSLHVRVRDAHGPCQIGYALEDGRPISWTFSTP